MVHHPAVFLLGLEKECADKTKCEKNRCDKNIKYMEKIKMFMVRIGFN